MLCSHILEEHIESAAFTTAAAAMAIGSGVHNINLVSSEDDLLLFTWMLCKWSRCEKQRTLPLSHVLLTPGSLPKGWGQPLRPGVKLLALRPMYYTQTTWQLHTLKQCFQSSQSYWQHNIEWPCHQHRGDAYAAALAARTCPGRVIMSVRQQYVEGRAHR